MPATFSSWKTTSRPTIRRAKFLPGDPAGGNAGRGHRAAPQHRDAVRNGRDLLQFVADEDDRFALGDHGTKCSEKSIDLLRRQHGGGLIHDEHLRAAIEHLQDLHALLLPHRELPDLGPRIDLQSKALGQGRHLLRRTRAGA